MSTPQRHEAVRELASSLIPIRPLRPWLKRPWPGEDGKAMTLDYDPALAWFEAHPDSNIGACLAPIANSPIVVVDIDICDVAENERQKVWAHLASVGVTTKSQTWIQRTGRDNWQVFYWWSPWNPAPPLRQVDAGKMHVDLLSNGYVVIAPSDTNLEPPKAPGAKGGGPYRWVKGHGPEDIPLAQVDEPPEALIKWWQDEAAMQPDPALPRLIIDGDTEDGSPITSHRNVTLAKIAGSLALRYGPAETRDRLHAINRARCQPPLGEREVDTIVGSINRREDGGRASVLVPAANAWMLG